LDPAIYLLGFANTYIFYSVLYVLGMDIIYVVDLPTKKDLPVNVSVKNIKDVDAMKTLLIIFTVILVV